MLKSKQLKFIIPIIVAIVLLIIGTIFLIVKNADKTKVYDNVHVLNEESENNELLVDIEENKLIFENEPGYVVGDVLVSGITEEAPDGFIRKVVSVGQENGQYVLQTEPGLITDVFEEAHVEKTFLITKEGATEVEDTDIAYSNSINDIINSSVATATGITRTNEHPSGDENYEFSCNGEYNINDYLSVRTEIGFSLWLEVKLEIEDGNVILGMTVHNLVGGDIFLGCSEEITKEFEEMIFSQELPSIQFAVGVVPIVITNQLYASVEGHVSLSGELGTVIAIQSEKVAGFEYNSATNEVIEIKENNYLSDGIDWSIGAKAKGEAAVGVFLHLTSKLYDSTGIDMSLGLEGTASAELATNFKMDGSSGECVGRIDLAIGPKLEGQIVVTVPVIDYELADFKIFEVELPTLWEHHWVSSEGWQEELETIENQSVEDSMEVSSMQGGIESELPNNTENSDGDFVFYDSDVLSMTTGNNRDIDIEAKLIIANAQDYNLTDNIFSVEAYFNDPTPYFLSEDDHQAYMLIYDDLGQKTNYANEQVGILFDNISSLFMGNTSTDDDYYNALNNNDNLAAIIFHYYRYLGIDYVNAYSEVGSGRIAGWRNAQYSNNGTEMGMGGDYILVADVIMYTPYYLRESVFQNKILMPDAIIDEIYASHREDTCLASLDYENNLTGYNYKYVREYIPYIELLVELGIQYESFSDLSTHELIYSSPILVPQEYCYYNWFDGSVSSAYVIPFYDKTANLYGLIWYDTNNRLMHISFGE